MRQFYRSDVAAAEELEFSRQRVETFSDPAKKPVPSLSHARGLNAEARRAIAEWLVGPGALFVQLPAELGAADVDAALAVQSECADVVRAQLEALRVSADVLTRSAATPLRKEIREAQRALAVLDAACAAAEREGVISLRRRRAV